MEQGQLIPIKLSKILPFGTDEGLVIYVPVDARRMLNLRKGMRIAIYVDLTNKCLVVKPVELGKEK